MTSAPRRTHLPPAGLLLAGLALVLAGCGGGGGAAAPGGGTGPGTGTVAAAGPPGAQTAAVTGDPQDRFTPAVVTARPGTLRLTFTVTGGTPHNLTFAGATVGPPIATTSSSATGEFHFTRPGDYRFVCTIHPGMEGRVTVAAG